MIYLPHRRKAFQSAAYTAYGAVFDGTNDYMLRGGDLTGTSDGNTLTVSLWFNFDSGTDGTEMRFVSSAGDTFKFYRSTNGRLRVTCTDSSLNIRCDSYSTTTTPGGGTGWHHIAISWLGSSNTYKCYIDGSSNHGGGGGDQTALDFTRTDWAVGSATNGGTKLKGIIAEVYVNLGEYIDISNAANLQKFRTAAGKPAGDLTVNKPLSSDPVIYLKNPYNSFGTNSGTGGDFTVTGSLTDGGTI